jgi:redox-sensitive bicupin YhaK (pirin superfamily)
MTTERQIRRIITTAAPEPGFAGAGHTAVQVVGPEDFAEADPFILLMDDRVEDRKGVPVGAAHPHAGIETVTFVVAGSLKDGDAEPLAAGDVQWMTAGSGIVHDEEMRAWGNLRILQLWVTLPKAARDAEPRFQDIHLGSLPIRREDGAELRLYSGISGNLRSQTRNHVPVTFADIHLQEGATISQDLPASYNGFVYVLSGSARVGAAGAVLRAGQVGWLDRGGPQGSSELTISAEEGSARLVLYAGEPQGDPLVMHGPFVADREEDIPRLYREYRNGQFPRMSELAQAVSDATAATSDENEPVPA